MSFLPKPPRQDIVVSELTSGRLYETWRWLEGIYTKLGTAAGIDWPLVDSSKASIADIGIKSHTLLTDIGTNTHAQIDTHVDNVSGNPHNTEWDMLVGISNHIPMDTAPTAVPTTEGTLSWNPEDHTLNVQTENADVRIQVGQEVLIRAVNGESTDTIYNGMAAYISGAQGNRPKILKALASDISSRNTIGIATHDIAKNLAGYITTLGVVHDVDFSVIMDTTTGLTEGDVLYCSESTAGKLTKTKPAQDNWWVKIGTVTKKVSDTGDIFVDVSEDQYRFGGATDYSKFETDGTLVFAGGATVWNDIIIYPNTLTAGGAPPIQRSYNTGNALGWAFNGTNDNSMMGWFEVPHDYKEGTDLDLHVHISPEGALTTGQTIIFIIAYDICGMGSATHTTGTVTGTYTAPASPLAAWAHIYLDIGAIVGTGRKIGDVCGFTVTRSALTDTYNGYVHLISIGSHYETDTVGSRTEYTK